MPGLGVTQTEMEALVRSIVEGADLSQMTGKVVREKVLEELGERAGDDARAIKRSIRDALRVVLPGVAPSPARARPAAPAPQQPPAQPKLEEGPVAPAEGPSRNGREEIQTGNTDIAADAPPEPNGEGPPAAEMHHAEGGERDEDMEGRDQDGDNADFVPAEPEMPLPPPMAVDASDHDADDEDEDFIVRRKPRSRPSSGQKRREQAAAEEHGGEDDGDDEVEYGSDRKERKAVPSSSEAPPAKRVRSHAYTTEKHLEKLRTICRLLGCPAPPSRMRGKTVPQKCAAVLDYLASKGVENPMSLNKKGLSVHRLRLEQEKELAGLDTSNIIEDGPRSRRSRVATPKREQNTELPSDFSGKELSQSSAHEEEGEEYEASSQDSD